jgi:hypothetical protein
MDCRAEPAAGQDLVAARRAWWRHFGALVLKVLK